MKRADDSLFDVLYGHLQEGWKASETERNEKSARTADELDVLVRRGWRNLAGPKLDDMLKDAGKCEEYLSHSDANLRCAAVYVGAYHWKPTAGFADAVTRMIDSDPDADVRKAAVDALVRCCPRIIPRSEVCKKLASLIKDRDTPVKIQRCAYYSLLILADRADEIRPSFEPFNLSDIDWTVVQNAEQGSLKPQSSELINGVPSELLGPAGKDWLAGLEAYGRQDYECAAVHFTSLLDAGTVYCNIYSMRGCALARIGSYEQAIDDFTSAIGIEPTSGLAYFSAKFGTCATGGSA